MRICLPSLPACRELGIRFADRSSPLLFYFPSLRFEAESRVKKKVLGSLSGRDSAGFPRRGAPRRALAGLSEPSGPPPGPSPRSRRLPRAGSAPRARPPGQRSVLSTGLLEPLGNLGRLSGARRPQSSPKVVFSPGKGLEGPAPHTVRAHEARGSALLPACRRKASRQRRPGGDPGGDPVTCPRKSAGGPRAGTGERPRQGPASWLPLD